MREIFHRSLHRRTTVLGGDRELVMFSALLCLLTALGGLNLISAALSLAFWLAALYWFRRWHKIDPLLRHVWLRQRSQQDFYPAKTSVWHKAKPTTCWRKVK